MDFDKEPYRSPQSSGALNLNSNHMTIFRLASTSSSTQKGYSRHGKIADIFLHSCRKEQAAGWMPHSRNCLTLKWQLDSAAKENCRVLAHVLLFPPNTSREFILNVRVKSENMPTTISTRWFYLTYHYWARLTNYANVPTSHEYSA